MLVGVPVLAVVAQRGLRLLEPLGQRSAHPAGAGAVANALDKLVSLGTAEMVTDKPRTYRLAAAVPEAAPAPDAAGDPAASAEAAPSAA